MAVRFVDVNEKPARKPISVHAEPNLVHAEPISVHAEPISVHAEPIIVHASDASKDARLGVARAALGGYAVEPAPLVDETKTRGSGRPRVHADRTAYKRAHERERRAAKRKAQANE